MLASAPAAFAAGPAVKFSTGIPSNSFPTGIAAGPDGNLWFTQEAPRVGRITPAGHIDEFSAGISAGSLPEQITAGPDGNLWFTERFGNRIGRITPSGHVDQFSTGITANAEPVGIAAGQDGNLWFAEAGIGAIGRITPAGHVDEFTAGITADARIQGIAAGPDGNLWFTEYGVNGVKIGRITPTGHVDEFTNGISQTAQPLRIAAGHDGNLWFTDTDDPGGIGRVTTTGVVTEYRTADGLTANSQPLGIAPGPDGNVWFVEQGTGQIGRVTPAGRIDEFPSGVPGQTAPAQIAAGPDGNLWFADAGDAIGRISTDDPEPSSGNLLRNPGFDAGTPGTSRTVTVPIPGWVTVPNFTEGLYGGTALPSTSLADQIGGGRGFGWGGIGSPDQSHALQLVDVGREGAAIDDGRATITLSGLLGGENGQEDTAKVTALFLTASGDQLGSVQIGPVTSADRGPHTTLLPRTISAPVLKGTRSIRVVGTATNIGGGSDNGYFDNLSLTLDVTPLPAQPAGPGPPGGPTGAGADTIAPLLGAARLTNKSFAVDTHGTAEAVVSARAKKAKKGTTFVYTLSEASRVLFTIEQRQKGRKVGRTCQKPSAKNRKKKACTRYVARGTFAQDGAAGANTKKFSGRIGKRKLAPGTYRATLVATDAAGNRSKVTRLAFKVVRK